MIQTTYTNNVNGKVDLETRKVFSCIFETNQGNQ